MVHLLFLLYLFQQNDQFSIEYDNRGVVGNLLAIREDFDYVNKRQINPFITPGMCQYSVDLRDSSQLVCKFTTCSQRNETYTTDSFFFNPKRELYRLIRYDSMTVNKKFFKGTKWTMTLSSKSGDYNFKDSVFWTSCGFEREPGQLKWSWIDFTDKNGRFKYRPASSPDSARLYRDPILIE